MRNIYSKFAGDEDWQELLQELIENLPQRVAALDQAIATDDFSALLVLVHQLKGACGSYGFDELTPLAGQVEQAMLKDSASGSWSAAMAEFRDALQRMTHRPEPCSTPHPV